MINEELPTPFAWATFDGEGSYDLRLYDDNESYHDEWVAANGQKYADWVIPLYTAQESATVKQAEASATCKNKPMDKNYDAEPWILQQSPQN